MFYLNIKIKKKIVLKKVKAILNNSTKIKIISQNSSTSVNAFSTSLTKFNINRIISNYSVKTVSVANFSINNSMLPPKNFVYIC